MAKKQQSGNISKRMQRRAEQRRKKRQTQLILGVVAVLLLALLAWAAFNGFSSSATTQVEALPAEISVAEAYQMYQEGAFVLDVRTQEEWDDNHIPNTTLIPLDELESRLDEVPRDQDVVVICLSGNRSQEGLDILINAGFERVTCVSGGLNAWLEAGYPTE
jgi:phage shock protein E